MGSGSGGWFGRAACCRLTHLEGGARKKRLIGVLGGCRSGGSLLAGLLVSPLGIFLRGFHGAHVDGLDAGEFEGGVAEDVGAEVEADEGEEARPDAEVGVVEA